MYDKEKITQQVIEVLEYSQNIEVSPKIAELIDKWEQKKQFFIKTFGGKLIYEFPEEVSFQLSDKIQDNKIAEFLYKLHDVWGADELANFVKAEEKGFFNNSVIENYALPNGKVITTGTKLIRAFKYFAEGRMLEDIQNEASRIIQENKLSGKLCISVHPLDFLSISENTYHWRSCHALDGEYRAGNLSYLVDSTTFVCYIKGEEEASLPHFPSTVPWNSKKWRVLIYLSEDKNMMFAGKQYPFCLTNALNYLKDTFFNTYFKQEEPSPFQIDDHTEWSNWTDKMINKTIIEGVECNSDRHYVPLGDSLKQLAEIMHDGDHTKHFNDVLSSSCYEPMYSFKYFNLSESKYSLTSQYRTKFTVGSGVKCIKCFNNWIYEEGDTMMCYDCWNSTDVEGYYCNCCQGKYYEDEGTYVNEEWICDYCLDKYYTQCEGCGEFIDNDYIYYCEEAESYFCEKCLNDWKERDDYGD